MIRNLDEILWKMQGLQTAETVAEELGLTKQSAINLLSKLKKLGYVTTKGGGKQKRLYKITTTIQRPRKEGMFDILNKYNPNFKLNPWYDHQVHGEYGVEEAIVDAIKTKSFRAILASLRLFSHVKDWRKLQRLAKEKDVWQEVGSMSELARKYFKAKNPFNNPEIKNKRTKYLIRDYKTYEESFMPITRKWKVYIPFRKGDLTKVAS